MLGVWVRVQCVIKSFTGGPEIIGEVFECCCGTSLIPRRIPVYHVNELIYFGYVLYLTFPYSYSSSHVSYLAFQSRPHSHTFNLGLSGHHVHFRSLMSETFSVRIFAGKVYLYAILLGKISTQAQHLYWLEICYSCHCI